MKLTHRFAVVCLLAMAILLTLGLSSCRKKTLTPQEYLAEVLENTFDVGESPFSKLDDTLLTELVWNGTSDTEMLGLDALNMKLYSSPDAGALELNATMFETPVSLKGYLKESSLAVQSDLLGDTVYGTDFSKLEQNYADSIFGDPDSMYYMGDFADLTSQIPATSMPEIDMEAIEAKYAKVLEDAIKDNMTATMTDREEGGKTVTFIFNNDSLKSIIKSLYDAAKTDTGLRDLLESILSGAEDLDDMLEEYDDFFASEDTLNEVLAEIDQGTFFLTLTVLTTEKDTIETATLTFDITAEGEQGKIDVILDLSEENTSVLTLNLDVPLEEGEEMPFKSISLIAEESPETADTYTYTFSLKMEMAEGPKVEMELIDLTYNKTSGAYEVVLFRDIPQIGIVSVKGQLTMTKDAVSLTVTDLAFGEDTIKVDVRIAVSAIKSVPAVPAYTEVFSLTEAQMDQIGENLMNHPLLSMIFGGTDEY